MFNKSLFAKNIKYLASKNDIKIGDLEKSIGVSAGYFSRLANEEPKTSNTILDIIYNLSVRFDTSIDSLLSMDLSSLTDSERLLNSFFENLIMQTQSGTLIWSGESVEQLNDSINTSRHPLYILRNSTMDEGYYTYNSMFDASIDVSDTGYNVDIGGKQLYLMSVKNLSTNESGYEMYILFCDEDSRVEKVCNAYPSSIMFTILDKLYKSAMESSNHVKLSPAVEKVIINYLR